MGEQASSGRELFGLLIFMAVSYGVLALVGLAYGNRDLVILSLAFGGASVPAAFAAYLFDLVTGGDAKVSAVVMSLFCGVLFFSFGLVLLEILGSLLPAWQMILLLVVALVLISGLEKARRRAKKKSRKEE